MERYLLEGCVDSVESAVAATRAGANRLELCGNLVIGGTTPTRALFEEVRANCGNRLHVLIRPRFGDFCYTGHEYRICLREVEQFRDMGAEGVVIGILKPDGSLDRERLGELKAAAGEMGVTLHRAFDVCNNPFEALETVRELGIPAILTSGQQNSCMEGRECIAELVKRSRGQVDIMVGSGVSAGIIRSMYETTGATSYHMSGKVVLDSRMEYRREGISMGLEGLSEYDIWRTGEQQIREAVQVLREL